jgi:hypothetical protein
VTPEPTPQPAPFEAPFELAVSLPADRQFAPAVATLAGQAARHVGCDETVAAQFGAEVAAALLEGIGAVAAGEAPPVALLLRRTGREIEAILTCGKRVRMARPIPVDA